MEFLGREKEMEVLENQYKKDHSFVLMYGRRRVGKSTLITRFIQGKKAVYYSVNDDLGSMYLSGFTEAIREATGSNISRFDSWSDAISFFVESSPGKKIIAIDEFQYLMMSDKGILRKFQSLWDNYLSKKNVMLILCGSHLSMMRNITSDYNSPLFQRNTAEIRIMPLPFEVTAEGKDHRRAVEEYAITGGVPFYMQLLDPDKTPVENIADLAILMGAPLINEPEHLLGSEFKNTGAYLRYLRTVADGNRKMGDICSATSTKASDAAPYLDKLQRVGMLRRDVPITADDPEHSRKGLYTVSDEFMAMWSRFIQPFRTSIDSGNCLPAIRYLNEHYIDRHVAFVFEDVCRQILRSTLEKLNVAAVYGTYWDNGIEIDIAALDIFSKTLYMGECKFWEAPVDSKVLTSLMSKTAGVEEFRKYTVRHCVFSVSGYTDAAIELAKEEDFILFDNGKLVDGVLPEVLYIDRLS